MKPFRRTAHLVALLVVTLSTPALLNGQTGFHGAPASAKSMVNPEEGDPQAVIAGKPFYHLRCARCHGEQLLYSSDGYPGRVYKLSLSGKVIGVIGESGKQLKQFGWIHEIACPSENELYVSELLNWRVQKLVLEPSH